MTNLEDHISAPLPKLPSREKDTYKGNYGRAFLVGGSPGMAGAIGLSGRAALRSGAGLVTVAIPVEIQNLVAGFDPCLMTFGWEEEKDRTVFEQIHNLASKATAIALGPGLGQSGIAIKLCGQLFETVNMPLVVDADGLNNIASLELLGRPVAGDRILTPHPGEFARLADDRQLAELANGSDSNRIKAAISLAQKDIRGRTIVVLKGHHTVVTDGVRYALNQTGNPGMATGGSGDVLTGIVTGLLCQGLSPWEAARLGVYLHGLAGDLAAAELGTVSLIATDLIDYLPVAIQSV